LGRKLKRLWWIPVLLGILLGAAGAYVANKRKPQYTATTKLTVGSVDYRTQSVPGFAQAAQTLASSYALTIRSSAVLAPLARTEHTTEAAIAGAVSATAVPNSTIFTISAVEPTKAAAIRVDGEAAKQAQRTVASLNTTSVDATSALRTFRRYAHQAAVAEQRVAALRRQKNVSNATLANAQTAASEAQALAGAYSTQYQVVITGNSPQSEARTITIIQPAVNAASDKRTYLERYGALGLAGGVVLGVLIALIIPDRRRRRATAAAPAG
jgi:capsular polysaccharide biosynthesis protein